MDVPTAQGCPPARSELTPFFDAFVLDRAVGELLTRTMAATAISPADYALYSAIDRDAEATPSGLAASIGVPRATMTDWLRTVEGRGHLERRRVPTDGRRWHVRLTESGQRVHADAQKAFGVAYVAFLRHYDGSPDALSRALRSATAATRRALDDLERSTPVDEERRDGAEGGT